MSCRRAEQWHAHMRPRLGRYPEQLTQSDWLEKITHARILPRVPSWSAPNMCLEPILRSFVVSVMVFACYCLHWWLIVLSFGARDEISPPKDLHEHE